MGIKPAKPFTYGDFSPKQFAKTLWLLCDDEGRTPVSAPHFRSACLANQWMRDNPYARTNK